MNDVDEYFGIKAELNKDTPEHVAGTLRIIADKIENAPNNRRYDLQLETREWVQLDTTEPNADDPESDESNGSELSDRNYNELKALAAEHGIDVGMTPEKDTLVTELQSVV